MISWPAPFVPALPGAAPTVRVHDVASGDLVDAATGPGAPVRLYVCGITPYDATHLGHAATYLTFDLLGRVLRDAGHQVDYVQNVTDVDDPLLERAERDGVDWRHLATDQLSLYREDMTALSVVPPRALVGVVESIDEIAAAVIELVDAGVTYAVDGDIYLDAGTDLGGISHLTRQQMVDVFPARGGDPDRAGKRDPLDPLLWRAERPGEPAWPQERLGAGRPGWHIECTAIARDRLGLPIDVQGGGSDLAFPHHEMSAVQADRLGMTFARAYVHQAMVGYHGEKMSKSKGNLVLVSRLRADGVEPVAIRLALLARHYRDDWEWTDADLTAAQQRLARWREALSVNEAAPAEETLRQIRAALADDLHAPAAVAVVDTWADATLGGDTSGGNAAPGLVARALDALLGVRV